MQQLNSEKASGADASFLCELFLQRLLSNVHMVLASTNITILDDLAQLAVQIIEVTTPSISNVSVSTEVEQLRMEIADQKRIVQSLLTPKV